MDTHFVVRGRRFLAFLVREANTKAIKALKERYPELAQSIDKLVADDPSGKQKYLKWQVSQLLRGEPVDEIVSLVRQFYKHSSRLEQKDLNQYKTLGELRAAFETLGDSKGEQKKIDKDNVYKSTDIVYQDDRFLVVRPESKDASCYFGRGTRWCVSATKSENFFRDYALTNVLLYFILDRNADPDTALNKIAYAFSSEGLEIFDSSDTPISNDDVNTYLGDRYTAIVEKIQQHKDKNPSTRLAELSKDLYTSDPKKMIEIANAGDSELVHSLLGNEEFRENIHSIWDDLTGKAQANIIEYAYDKVAWGHRGYNFVESIFKRLKPEGFSILADKDSIPSTSEAVKYIYEYDKMPSLSKSQAALASAKAAFMDEAIMSKFINQMSDEQLNFALSVYNFHAGVHAIEEHVTKIDQSRYPILDKSYKKVRELLFFMKEWEKLAALLKAKNDQYEAVTILVTYHDRLTSDQINGFLSVVQDASMHEAVEEHINKTKDKVAARYGRYIRAIGIRRKDE